MRTKTSSKTAQDDSSHLVQQNMQGKGCEAELH